MGITRNITLPISAPSTSIKNSTEQAKVTTTNTQIVSTITELQMITVTTRLIMLLSLYMYSFNRRCRIYLSFIFLLAH